MPLRYAMYLISSERLPANKVEEDVSLEKGNHGA